MSGVSNVAQSIDAVNQVLQAAQTKAMQTAEKMMKVNVAMTLGQETGKGNLIDLVA